MQVSNRTWEKTPIKNLYQGLFDGPHATPKPSENGPIFLGIKNITEDGRMDLSEIRHISEDDFPTWTKRVTPQKDDIVFSYEATLNRYCLIPEGFRGCLGRRLALIRPDKSKVIPSFLYYYFFSNEWRDLIAKNTISGSTVDRIPLIEFPNFEVRLPSMPTQIKIASILSTFDRLISNNAKRISILETVTKILYREWFVKFRFPGHENVNMVQSELGMIPAGWLRNYSEQVDFLEGPGLRRWQYKDDGIPFLNIRTLIDNDIDFSKVQYIDKDEVNAKFKHFLLEPYDHVVSSSGTIGRIVTIQMHHLPLMLNTSIIRMRPRTEAIGKWQLKHFLKSDYFQNQIKAQATGVAQMNYGPSHLKQMWIIAPSIDIGQHYEQIVAPIEEQVCKLAQKNNKLRQTCDMLMPKLISGELCVEDLDIDTGGIE